MNILQRNKWARFQGRVHVTERIQALNGGLEERHYHARLVGSHDGWLITDNVVAKEAGPNGSDVPLPGQKWFRNDTVVHMGRPDA